MTTRVRTISLKEAYEVCNNKNSIEIALKEFIEADNFYVYVAGLNRPHIKKLFIAEDMDIMELQGYVFLFECSDKNKTYHYIPFFKVAAEEVLEDILFQITEYCEQGKLEIFFPKNKNSNSLINTLEIFGFEELQYVFKKLAKNGSRNFPDVALEKKVASAEILEKSGLTPLIYSSFDYLLPDGSGNKSELMVEAYKTDKLKKEYIATIYFHVDEELKNIFIRSYYENEELSQDTRKVVLNSILAFLRQKRNFKKYHCYTMIPECDSDAIEIFQDVNFTLKGYSMTIYL